MNETQRAPDTHAGVPRAVKRTEPPPRCESRDSRGRWSWLLLVDPLLGKGFRLPRRLIRVGIPDWGPELMHPTTSRDRRDAVITEWSCELEECLHAVTLIRERRGDQFHHPARANCRRIFRARTSSCFTIGHASASHVRVVIVRISSSKRTYGSRNCIRTPTIVESTPLRCRSGQRAPSGLSPGCPAPAACIGRTGTTASHGPRSSLFGS